MGDESVTPLEIAAFPEKVLVVDDEPVIAQILGQALTEGGLDAEAVGCGADALRILRETGVGCLLTDKNLPDVNGIELLRRARELQPWCGCIVVTGFASVESAIEALRLGASDYLEKPLPDLELVVEKVRLVLANDRLRFERDLLLARLRQFESELGHGPFPEAARNELELFNELIERRVGKATEDLRERCRMLSHQLAHSKGLDFTTRLSADAVLGTLRSIRLDGDAPPASIRGELARVIRQLEDHRELLQKPPPPKE
jgi:DNA-binding response OmpR family regulator